jgi:hypothetical protein
MGADVNANRTDSQAVRPARAEGRAPGAGTAWVGGVDGGAAVGGSLGNTQIKDTREEPPGDGNRLFIKIGAKRRAAILLRSKVQNLTVPSSFWSEARSTCEALLGRELTESNADAKLINEHLPSGIKRFRACGRVAVSSEVGLTLNSEGRSGTRSLSSCARGMLCPTCSVTVRSERTDTAAKIFGEVQKRGGRLVFVTYTMRHRKSDALTDNLAVLREATHRITNSREWHRWRDTYGLSYVSAIEITYGEAGFHVHQHQMICTGVARVRRGREVVDETTGEIATFEEDDPKHIPTSWVKTGAPMEVWTPESTITARDGDSLREVTLEEWLRLRWLEIVAEHLGSKGLKITKADKLRALDFVPWATDEDPKKAAHYLLKGAFEITRGDLKKSVRDNGDRATVPIEVVMQRAVDGDKKAEAVFWEYEAAVRGLRYFRKSWGILSALDICDRELTESEILDQAERVGAVVMTITPRSWFALARACLVGDVLDLLQERGPDLALAWCIERGFDAALRRPPPKFLANATLLARNSCGRVEC